MPVTHAERNDIVVHRPTPDEAWEALEAAIAETGCTREELEAQARAGRFESALAHQTWYSLPPPCRLTSVREGASAG